MIANNAIEEAIDKWTAELDEKLGKMEQLIADREEETKNQERKKSIEERNQEEQRFERKIREEKHIVERKEELQKTSRIKEENSNKDPEYKLPKLLISQLNGTHTDYFRFWNQFETKIGKSELLSVTKLS